MGAILHDPAGRELVGFIDTSAHQYRYLGNGRIHANARPPVLAIAANLGVSGCIHRIGNGTSLDHSFALQWPQMRTHMEGRGAYLYLQPNVLGARQSIDLMARWLEPYAAELNLPWMLDFEEYHGPQLNPRAMSDWLWAAFERVLQLSGRPALLYAGNAFANANTLATSTLVDTVQPRYSKAGEPPLHVGQWGSWIRWDSQPIVNGRLGPWDAWQFTAFASWRKYGGPSDSSAKNLDLNVIPLTTWNHWLDAGEDTDMHLVNPHALLYDGPINAGSPVIVTIPATPAGKPPRGAVINITIASPTKNGFVLAGASVSTQVSCGNYEAGELASSSPATVAVDDDNRIQVWINDGSARVVIALQAIIT